MNILSIFITFRIIFMLIYYIVVYTIQTGMKSESMSQTLSTNRYYKSIFLSFLSIFFVKFLLI